MQHGREQADDRYEAERIPPELDPELERFDDGRPPRTMRRRLQPFLWIIGALTLVAMLALVTPGI